jgi:Universal stress protein family
METVSASQRIALKNILFLTDFSEPSAAAIPYATLMARAYGAKVTALHVVVPAACSYMTTEMSASLLGRSRGCSQDRDGQGGSRICGPS